MRPESGEHRRQRQPGVCGRDRPAQEDAAGDQCDGGEKGQRPRQPARGLPVAVVVASQQEISQQNRLSTASAPIQRAAGESTWTTTRSRARNRGAKLTRESLTAKGYARYLFAPGKYLTMPSCTTVANN